MTTILASPRATTEPAQHAVDDLRLARRTVRRLLDELTGAVADVPVARIDRAIVVGAAVRDVVALLADLERALVRAVLRVERRDPDSAAHIAEVRARRGQLDVQIARVRLALPYWERNGSSVCRDTVWEVLLDLGATVDALFAAENDRIVAAVVADDLPPLATRGPWQGHVLETLTTSAARAWLRHRMSSAERLLWRLVDAPRFRRARRRVLG